MPLLFQLLSHVWVFVTPWIAAHRASLSFTTISCSLLWLRSIESMMPSYHLIFFCPLFLLSSVFLSIRAFSTESAPHIRWPKYWSFSFSISPSSEYSGLIPFRMDWLDLLAVQGALSVSSSTTAQKHQFFVAQPLHDSPLTSIHDYWRNHRFDYIWTFVGQSDVAGF